MKDSQLKKFIISEKESLKDAIIKLNKFGQRVLFVCNKNKVIIGSLRDGDIRKALIKNDTLEQVVRYAANKRFIYIKNKIEIEKKLTFIKKNNIIFIPLCDKKKN